MTIAFPTPDLGWLAWVGLVPLFMAIDRSRSAMQAAAYSYLFGVIHWGWTTTWIGKTVVHWAGSDIGWLAWLILNLIESCWYAFFGLAAWALMRNAYVWQRPFILASLWTMLEWLRTMGSLAMPWSLIGYTQYRYLAIIQIAGLTGIYGVSFLIVLVNGALQLRLSRNSRPALCMEAVVVILLIGAIIYGCVELRRPVQGERVHLDIMQPDARSARGDYPDPDRDYALFTKMASVLPTKTHAQTRICLWPESISPGDAINDTQVRSFYSQLARTSHTWQFLGTYYEDAQGRPYNSAALFDPQGRPSGRYDKTQLVPFGEWTPARRWMPFPELFHYPTYDCVPGVIEDPLSAGPARICPLICYESAFPVITRRRTIRGANLLVCLTNDSWAGKSKVQWQHAAMGVFRAVETRRTFAASTTTGITFISDPFGRITTIPGYGIGNLSVEATLVTKLSLYVRAGDWFMGLCGIIIGSALLSLYHARGRGVPQP